MASTGYLYYDGYSYKLSTPSGQKGDKGDKGDQGDIGPQGFYVDGYTSIAIEKAISGIKENHLLNPSGKLKLQTIVSDLSSDLSISGSLLSIDVSEDIIYFITDNTSTQPIYGIDNFSGDLVFNPTITESVSWKEIKYARLNGIEVICLASDNGFSYYDITNTTYYSTSTNGISGNCSKMYVDSKEVSFFVGGRVYTLTSDGSNLSLDYNQIQPISMYGTAFHKAFGYYYNSDSSDTSKVYKIDIENSSIIELDIGYVTECSTIFSDSEYVYTIAFSEEMKKIKTDDFEIKSSIDLEALIGLSGIDPFFVHYDGLRFVMPIPNINRIILFYPSKNTVDIINPSTSMDASCRQLWNNHLGFILSGGSDIISASYDKRFVINKLYSSGGVFKKPTYIDNTLSPYTVTSDDSVICCSTATGNITIDFPSNISLFGLEVVVVDVDGSASANNITLSGTNANNGAGATISSDFGRKVAYCYLTDSGPDAYWVIS